MSDYTPSPRPGWSGLSPEDAVRRVQAADAAACFAQAQRDARQEPGLILTEADEDFLRSCGIEVPE